MKNKAELLGRKLQGLRPSRDHAFPRKLAARRETPDTTKSTGVAKAKLCFRVAHADSKNTFCHVVPAKVPGMM